MIQESDVDQVVDLVRAYSSERLGSAERCMKIGADDPLSFWGLDSMDLVCVSAIIEDQFDCEIDPTTFLKASTIRLAIRNILEDQNCITA